MDTLYITIMKNNRNSNKVLALASALVALGAGFSFNFWYATDSYATAQNVDAREIWDLALFKTAKKHTSPQPDPTPTTPAPCMPAPKADKPKVKKYERIKFNPNIIATYPNWDKLVQVRVYNERVYSKVA